jgi:hypothetical protein
LLFKAKGAKEMEPNEARIKIMNFLRFTGPSLPINVSKGCNLPTLIISAFLAEMVENKQIKISHLKYGGSPLYYLPTQENLLENFLSHLNSFDQEIFAKLKKEGVLEDSKQEPVHRVGLRAIKDFAFPLRIVHNSQEKLFWKIYSLTDQGAFEKIKAILEPVIEVKPEIKKEIKIEEKKEEKAKKPRKRKVEKELVEEKSDKKDIQFEEKKIETPKIEVREEKKIELPIVKEEILEVKEEKPARKTKGKFDIREWMIENKIVLVNEMFNKPKEAAFLINVPSSIGELRFYAVFKDKKSISESDIVMTYQSSQEVKLPLFLITTGKLTKKAQEYANNLKINIKQV